MYFIDCTIYSCPNFPPFALLYPVLPIPSGNPPLSSCPWVMHISFFGYSISYTVLNIPHLFCTYQFVLLNPCTFSPFALPTGNPPNDLHIYDSVSVLLVCLVHSLDSIVASCEFIAVLIGPYFLISSFCLAACVGFHVLGRAALTPCLSSVASCRKVGP